MKIVETPRDAYQGIRKFIPTDVKIKYINSLLRVGFSMIEVGSFVSKTIVPQMSDTEDVINGIYKDTDTKISVIVGNKYGAKMAAKNDIIDYIGFPFSISKTFAEKNIGCDIQKSIDRINDIVDISNSYNKNVIVYMSMGFGNPYGDEWNVDILLDYIDILMNIGVEEINISDTIGISTTESITNAFSNAIKEFPSIEFGLHLHSDDNNWYKKLEASYDAGVNKYDATIGGHGGCPLSGYDMIGNLDTMNLIDFCFDKDIKTNIDNEWLNKSIELSKNIFNNYQ